MSRAGRAGSGHSLRVPTDSPDAVKADIGDLVWCTNKELMRLWPALN